MVFDKLVALERKFATLEVRREEGSEGILWLILNRPQVRNAMSMELLEDMHAVLDALMGTDPANLEQVDTQGRRAPRVVILVGNGPTFCAGADMLALEKGVGGRKWDVRTLQNQQMFSQIVVKMRRIPQPIIAGLQGGVAGGGFSISMAADVRIATPCMKAHAAFVNLGLTGCEMGSSWFLPRLVGQSVASELLLTAQPIAADRALAVGLISKIVQAENLRRECVTMASHMLLSSALGLRMTKECLNATQSTSFQSQMDLEDRGQSMCLNNEACNEIAHKYKTRFTKKAKL